jgi:hypothetical protein
MGKRKVNYMGDGPLPAPTDPADANQTLLTAADIAARREASRKAKAKAEAEAPKPATVQSKAQAKKLAQIADRKRKAAERESVMASLAANQLSNSQLKLLSSSGSLGQSQSKRQRLQRALHAKREGATLDNLEPLEVEREVPSDDEYEPAALAKVEASSVGGGGRGGGSGGGGGGGGSSSSRVAAGSSSTSIKKPATSSATVDVHGADEDDDLDDLDLGDAQDDAYWARRAMGFGSALQGLQPGASAPGTAPALKGKRQKARAAPPSRDELAPAVVDEAMPRAAKPDERPTQGAVASTCMQGRSAARSSDERPTQGAVVSTCMQGRSAARSSDERPTVTKPVAAAAAATATAATVQAAAAMGSDASAAPSCHAPAAAATSSAPAAVAGVAAVAASAPAQRLVREQFRTLGRVRDAIRSAGVRRYRKYDHWAWYAFPTTKSGDSDPADTALRDAADARAVLSTPEPRGAWTAVLELLANACEAQRTRHVLPAIDHGRVRFFVQEWARPDGVFHQVAAEHPRFEQALMRFAKVWDSLAGRAEVATGEKGAVLGEEAKDEAEDEDDEEAEDEEGEDMEEDEEEDEDDEEEEEEEGEDDDDDEEGEGGEESEVDEEEEEEEDDDEDSDEEGEGATETGVKEKPLSALAQAILAMMDPAGAELTEAQAETEAVGMGILSGRLQGLHTSRAGVEQMRRAQPKLPGLPQLKHAPEAEPAAMEDEDAAAAAAAGGAAAAAGATKGRVKGRPAVREERVGRRLVTDTLSVGIEGAAGGEGEGEGGGSSTRYVKVHRPEKIELARAQLPIYAEEQRIMEALHDSDVLILCGETGSGKATELPLRGPALHASAHPSARALLQVRRRSCLSSSTRQATRIRMRVGAKGS